MSKTKFKVGDKVVPISKSVGSSDFPDKNMRIAKENGQPYLYVTAINRNGDYMDVGINMYYTCSHREHGGNFFAEHDLILFNENPDNLLAMLINGNISDEQYTHFTQST